MTETRLFMTDGNNYFRIFKFGQGKDSSIYVTAPSFSDILWLTLKKDLSAITASNVLSDKAHLSFHGSGDVHVRSEEHSKERQLRIKGNFLESPDKQKLGVRHLFTTLITKPDLPVDLATFSKKKSNYALKAEYLLPYIIVFWAVPAIRKLSIQVNASFNTNDLETIPPESGFGYFSLRFHSIVWYAYRTKHMQGWPKRPCISYHDGYLVPLIINTAEGNARVEMRSPRYKLSENELEVSI